jgi:PAS domain S-box-containing protein
MAPEIVGTSRASILYADDTEAQRYAVSRVLRRAGFEVQEASTGRQALELSANGPDMVLLDVNLPDISGIEVCKQIKSNSATAHVPVLQVSATLVDTKDRVAGLEGGADAYLVQPIDADELVATVRSLLRVRKAEEDARRKAREIESIYASAPVGLAMFDRHLRFTRINDLLAGLNGLTAEQHLGRTLPELFPELWSKIGHLYQHALSTGEPQLNYETKAPAPFQPAVARDWLISLHPLKDDRGQATGINAVVQEITDRKKAEELTIKQETQRQLLEREILARESERERLARELHDESGQMLTSLLAGLRLIDDSKTLVGAKKRARVLRDLTSRAIGDVGRLSRNLHPIVLDDLGLAVALKNYVTEYGNLHGINAEIKINGLETRRLPREMERGLYRIMQEALTNVARHARASEVHVHISLQESDLTMVIEDNGCGFQVHSGTAEVRTHLGLQGMRERASIMGGTFKAESTFGKGTCITVSVTLH